MECDPARRTLHITIAPDQPLVGVLVEVDGRSVARYFADDPAAPGTDETLKAARAVIGAWEDLEPWEEVSDALDRIRHDSVPTPPIEL